MNKVQSLFQSPGWPTQHNGQYIYIAKASEEHLITYPKTYEILGLCNIKMTI